MRKRIACLQNAPKGEPYCTQSAIGFSFFFADFLAIWSLNINEP